MTAPPKTNAQLESTLELYFFRRVRSLGGMAAKLAPTQAGMPDRLILLPSGIVRLVELKVVKGPLRPIQKVWHDRAANLGVPVSVLHGKDEIDAWLLDVLDERFEESK